jgi:hypothetical protein
VFCVSVGRAHNLLVTGWAVRVVEMLTHIRTQLLSFPVGLDALDGWCVTQRVSERLLDVRVDCGGVGVCAMSKC